MTRRNSSLLVLALAIPALSACTSGEVGETTGGPGGASAGTGTGSPGSSGNGAASGAGGTAVGAGGAGGSAPSGKIPMFVAQGDLGRTMVSCDDGKTWVGNHSWDIDGDPIVCGKKFAGHCYDSTCSFFQNGQCNELPCCGDTPDRARGIAYGDGHFAGTWGWGQPGAIRTSDNGIDWVTTSPADSFGGVAYGSGRFVAASRSPLWSTDAARWTPGGDADFQESDGSIMWSVRRFGYGDYQGGGRFVAVASGNISRDMLVSSDAGDSWWRPKQIPDECGNSVMVYGGIVSGNGIIVIVGQDAWACRSTDGGETWTATPTGLSEVLSGGVWTGQEFWFWGDDGYRISSPDGATWTKTALATPMRIEPVARSDSGTIVANSNVWSAYEQQQLLRSTDGLTWEALPASAFTGSHPIFAITFGYAEPSALCPAP